ncbi:MAG: hypothetical protein IJ183_06600 [Prevotella sp.]|nr:hypothetical protein [Prevotella sp.]MBQ9560665.1 hypothetical protein [Prevotella sp.]MBR1839321.1 hypothetical protein [Prevotella sp.]
MMPQAVSAQGFLGKLSKGLEKVNKGLDNASTKAQVTTGQAEQQANGVVVMNPVSKAMSIEVLKAIGRSTSENFGNVELVLRVNVKEPVNSIALGGSWGQGKTQAFDADGNVYKMNMPSVSDRYDVTEGIPVKITCNPFLKVRKTSSLAIVKIVAKCGEASGEVTLKNVPIEWDPVEE